MMRLPYKAVAAFGGLRTGPGSFPDYSDGGVARANWATQRRVGPGAPPPRQQAGLEPQGAVKAGRYSEDA